LRQAYDYWQDQPGSYSFPHYRQSNGATQPTKGFLPNGAAAPLAGEIRAKTPGCNSRIKPPQHANSRFGPRFRARSPLSDPRWCNACSFRPRSFTPYLATRAYVPGAQPVPPFARLRSGRPLSLRIIPCTPKTSKPRTKSLSDESHCGPGRMFRAARGYRGGMPSPTESIEPRVGALRRALLYRGGSRGRV